MSKLCVILCIGLSLAEFTNAQVVPHKRLTNAQPANSGQFPWVVNVHGVVEEGQPAIDCTGALITEVFVVSAKHCANPKYLSTYRITLGTTTIEDINKNELGVSKSGSIVIDSDRILINGELAILCMTRPITFTNTIRPINLPSEDDFVGAEVPVTLNSWDQYQSSRQVFYTALSTITNKECRKTYPELEHDALCYSNIYETTCLGEFGSPIVEYENDDPVLVAINNQGSCEINEPSFGIRITSHVEWINGQIADTERKIRLIEEAKNNSS